MEQQPGRARCDLVLLGWTAFITLNLASDYFWSRGNDEAEDVTKSGGSALVGAAEIYMGSYTLESNGTLLEEGLIRLGFGAQPSSLMSVHVSSASLALLPKERQHSYGPLQSQLLFTGVEFGGAGRTIAIGNTDPRTFRQFGPRACVVYTSFDSGFEAAAVEHLGDHPASPRISGEVVAEKCGFRLSFSSLVVDQDYLSSKVVHYSVWVSIICLWQIRCFLHQLSQADDGPAVSKVSMLCIAIQALTDAYDSFLHLCLGLSSQYLFNSMSMVALFKFLLCSLLEARYLLIILRHRRHEAFSEGWESVRREVSWLYTRFYGALVVGSLMVYNCLAYLDVVVLVLQLYWVPQIAFDAWQGSRNTLKPTFITSISASRLLLPLYLWGCPKTIFTGEIYPRLPGAQSLRWCLLLVGLQAIQVGILLLQKRLGARWFIPWVCMPWAYNYHRFMEIEAGSECVICMADLNPEDGLRVVTPCSHSFHQACLEQWMDVKMECPTCRAVLPPLQ